MHGLRDDARVTARRGGARGRRRRLEVVVVHGVIHGDVRRVGRERARRHDDGRDGGVGDTMG